MKPNVFLSGQRCSRCRYKRSHKNTRKSHRQFIEEVLKLVGNEYIVLSEYSTTNHKIKMRHNNEACNYYEYEVTPNKFLSNRRCPKCSYIQRGKDKSKGLEKFKQEVFALTSGEYIVLSNNYSNNHTKVKIKHLNDFCMNYEWEIKPNNFLNGQRCPICNESKGAREIRIYLQSHNISFDREYTFNDLLGIKGTRLRFDFAVFNKNGNLAFLIEYDGEFHEKQIHQDHDLGVQQYHDALKDKYALDNKIKLLRINYRDQDNIENILKHVFKKP
ncbi:hypothetical protein P5491_012880 [Priestia megaterium]|uniref:hypothetical protein n=1 Tax=Priestia megaterium TaxID=1404 RepID=UPI002452F0D1|nr:hypothetical protein [Priestia megaterium]MDH3141980.1 hypothetical protein [Priestia megaterium]